MRLSAWRSQIAQVEKQSTTSVDCLNVDAEIVMVPASNTDHRLRRVLIKAWNTSASNVEALVIIRHVPL